MARREKSCLAVSGQCFLADFAQHDCRHSKPFAVQWLEHELI
jgi:hypothetical protein